MTTYNKISDTKLEVITEVRKTRDKEELEYSKARLQEHLDEINLMLKEFD